MRSAEGHSGTSPLALPSGEVGWRDDTAPTEEAGYGMDSPVPLRIAARHCLAMGCGVSATNPGDNAETLLISRMFSNEDGACRFDQVQLPLTEGVCTARGASRGRAADAGRTLRLYAHPTRLGYENSTQHRISS
jgi:hypothetical protein